MSSLSQAPTGDGFYSEHVPVPLDGVLYDKLDEDVADGTTTMVRHSDSGSKTSTFTFDPCGLPSNAVISTVLITITTRRTFAGAVFLGPYSRLGGVDTPGGDDFDPNYLMAISDDWAETTGGFILDPNLSAWTPSTIDSAEFGVLSTNLWVGGSTPRHQITKLVRIIEYTIPGIKTFPVTVTVTREFSEDSMATQEVSKESKSTRQCAAASKSTRSKADSSKSTRTLAVATTVERERSVTG